jgi:WD40 repeat protein
VRAAATGVEARRRPSPAGEAGSALAWAPSGGGFAIGTVAGHVMLGDPATATLVPCDGHAGEVYDVRFSPSGHQLASIGKDGVLIIRDGATGATVARLRDGAGVASSLAWLGDDRVITGDDRGVVRIWRLADRLVERRLAHPGAIYGVVVGGGARPYVATFGDGTTVLVWDVATGEVRARLPGHRLATDIVVTVGSLLVTTDEPGDVFVWDPDSGERLAALPPEGGLAAVVVGGTRIALVGDGRQRVWEVARDAGRRHLDGHRARIRDLAFTADGQRLLSASNDGSARVVDLATGEARALGEAGFAEPALPTLEAAAAQRPNPHGLRSLALAPDQATVVTASEDGAVTAWDVVTGARRAAWPGHVGRVRRVVFAADGRVAFSVGDTTLRRWDVAAGRELARRDLGEAPWDLALVGQDVVATQTDGGTIALWRAADLTPIATAPLRTKLHELTVVGDEVLDAGRLDVAVIDRAGTTRRRGTVSDAFTAAVSASSSGSRLLAVGTTVHQLVLLDWATLTPVRTWANDDLVVALRFRPDGRLLASASGRKLRVWDPATGNLLIESPELPGLLTQLAWSPDGTRLAAAGGAGTIWVWELGGRTPAALAAIAACASPWRLVDGALVGVPFDAAACAVPAR